MNKRIEKFLIWACLAQAFGWIAAQVFPGILSVIILKSAEMESSLPVSLVGGYFISLLSIFAYIPLRIVCGLWMKKESERIKASSLIWFWTGFLFQFLGVIAFYAYLAYCSKTEVEPAVIVNDGAAPRRD